MFWRRKPFDRLDEPLWNWTQRDPFTRRHLVQSIAVQGASGSGKTTGPGNLIADRVVPAKDISLLILASKPEDRGWWQMKFARAGRRKDLLIFSPDSNLRMNFMGDEYRQGADTRELTQMLMQTSETVTRAGGNAGREDDAFFKMETGRMLHMSIDAVRLATGDVSTVHIQQFLTGVARSSDEVHTPEWRERFTSKMLEAASNARKTPIEEMDYAQVFNYFIHELPNMNDRTRSSIEAGTNQILFTCNSGIVRELLCTKSNVSPAVLDQGKSILVDMPVSRYGASGAFVNAVWKLLVQKYILRRHANV